MPNRDFTLETYKCLLNRIADSDYHFLSFDNYLLSKPLHKKIVILRHDVDRKPKCALEMARLENDFHINASYYFRAIEQTHKKDVINEIALMGHEIGYHYEDLCLCRGNYQLAIEKFQENLENLRKLYPIKTICMHGSPLSKWDNRLIWRKYDYRDFGIIGEPYFDIDFNQVLYLTDTGRRWNGSGVAVRDKVKTTLNYNLKCTEQIIMAFQSGDFPTQSMMNVHPQRWTDEWLPWTKELIWQNIKNVIKRIWTAKNHGV